MFYFRSQVGALWLRHLIQAHTSQLLANPDLADLISPILGTIESRLTQLTPLSRLKGRLDLLVTQISNSSRKVEEADDALLVYKDQGIIFKLLFKFLTWQILIV